MKRLLLIVLPLLLIVGCSKEPINYETTLIERDDIYYTKDTNEPYSGQVFSLHQNGQKESETTYKDGKPNGLWTDWYKDGKKKTETTFKNGKPNGLFTNWYDNGQKFGEGTYKDGKQISFKEWNEDGSVK